MDNILVSFKIINKKLSNENNCHQIFDNLNNYFGL